MHFIPLKSKRSPWEYIVCRDPGLGQTEPTGFLMEEQTWNMINESYPYPTYYGFGNTADDVDEYRFKAYIFPDHCINLLIYENEIYLYDLSFGDNAR